MKKTPEEWIEYCEKNQDWIKDYEKKNRNGKEKDSKEDV